MLPHRECPACEGYGHQYYRMEDEDGRTGYLEEQCKRCNGTGDFVEEDE